VLVATAKILYLFIKGKRAFLRGEKGKQEGERGKGKGKRDGVI